MFLKARSRIIFPALFLLAVIAGYYLSRTADQPESKPHEPPEITEHSSQASLPENKPLTRSARRTPLGSEKSILPPFAKPNELIARFKDDEAYRKFLASLKSRGLRLLGKSDHFRAVRFGFGPGFNPDDIEVLRRATTTLLPCQNHRQLKPRLER